MKKNYYPLLILFIGISCSAQNILTEDNLLKDNTTEGLDAFGKYIWSRNKDSIVVIHKKNLDIVYKKIKADDNNYFMSLYSYCIYIPKLDRTGKNLSFAERTYVAAHVVDYLYRCQKKMKKDNPFKALNFVSRLLGNNTHDYNSELKKNDYYGLALLKENHLKHYVNFFEDAYLPSRLLNAKKLLPSNSKYTIGR